MEFTVSLATLSVRRCDNFCSLPLRFVHFTREIAHCLAFVLKYWMQESLSLYQLLAYPSAVKTMY